MKDEVSVILVVDDTPANLEVLFELLDEKGFEVLTATNGESGIKRAKHAQPDLILLDVMMPDIDGFETCLRLKAHEKTRNIPIIFMTALTKTDNKVKGLELGAVDYITKPIQAQEVMARIRTHLTIQQLQNDVQAKNRDLTAALERERELNALKSRFISMASHELRTPLTTMNVSADLLQRYGHRMSDEKKDEELGLIKKTIKRMTGLLDEVLMASKAEAGRFEYHPALIDVKEFCQRIVDQFKAMSVETHTIVFSCQGNTFQASVDAQLLEHILSNLLSNAIKYSPAGGIVSVEFESHPESMTFRIKDEGIGISEADQQHLFDAFHRGENVGDIKGTGLGMSIVKQFVELHGGTIHVDSELQKGATFTINLPLHD